MFVYRILLILLLTPSVFAGVDDFPSDPWTLYLFSETPDLNFNFNSLVNEGQAGVEYKPNVGTPSGIGFSYAGLIGFRYTTEINEEKVTDDKGSTSYDDYRFTFAFSKFLIGLDYLEYKGFFINNTAAIDATSSEPFIKRPDLQVSNIGARFIWVFSPERYSLPNIIDQTERQNSSGGSWMVGGNFTQFEFEADSAVIPSNVQSEFGADATITDGRFSSVTATGGYGYTWVLKNKFYAGLMALVGTGYQVRSYNTANGKISDGGAVSKFDARLALGYNGDSFFFAMYTEGDTTKFKTETVEIQSSLIKFSAALGIRF